MAKKRGTGEESIRKRPNGTFEVQVTLEGRRLSRTFKTQRECLEWQKKVRNQIDDGMTFKSTRFTLQEYLAGWLTSIKSSTKQRTGSHYEQLVRKYISPNLG